MVKGTHKVSGYVYVLNSVILGKAEQKFRVKSGLFSIL